MATGRKTLEQTLGLVGCTPQSCATQGLECGAAADGCGGIVQCGNCPPGSSCGAYGPNKCGPTPVGSTKTPVVPRFSGTPKPTEPPAQASPYLPQGGARQLPSLPQGGARQQENPSPYSPQGPEQRQQQPQAPSVVGWQGAAKSEIKALPTEAAAPAFLYVAACGKAYEKGAKDGDAKKQPAYAVPTGWSERDSKTFDHMYLSAWEAHTNMTVDTKTTAAEKRSQYSTETGRALGSGISDGYYGQPQSYEPVYTWYAGQNGDGVSYDGNLRETYKAGYIKGQELAGVDVETQNKSAAKSLGWALLGGAAIIGAVAAGLFWVDKSGARSNPARRGKINDRDYKYWVVYNGKIVGGNEYRSDAADFIKDWEDPALCAKMRIYTRSGLRGFGVDPDNNEHWATDNWWTNN